METGRQSYRCWLCAITAVMLSMFVQACGYFPVRNTSTDYWKFTRNGEEFQLRQMGGHQPMVYRDTVSGRSRVTIDLGFGTHIYYWDDAQPITGVTYKLPESDVVLPSGGEDLLRRYHPEGIKIKFLEILRNTKYPQSLDVALEVECLTIRYYGDQDTTRYYIKGRMRKPFLIWSPWGEGYVRPERYAELEKQNSSNKP